MAEPVKIFQLTDPNGKPISPLTSESAIYDENGNRLSDKLIGVDFTKIKEAQDNAIESIEAAADGVYSNTGVSEYPNFSAASSYAAGDIVNYEGLLYEFTASHPAGEWIGTDATRTSLKKETEQKLTELENEIVLTRNIENIEADIQQRNAFNNCVKSLYLIDKPKENEVYVVTYFKQQSETLYVLTLSRYNTVTEDTSIVAAQRVYESDKVVPLYKDSNKEIVGYIYISSKDYTISVSNSGQGIKRMPYLNDVCYNLNNQSLISKYLLEQELIKIDEKYLLFKSDKLSNTDITKWNNSNSAIKALWVKNKPAIGMRLITTFFNKFGDDKFQLGLSLYNVTEKTKEDISGVTGLIYEFDKVVEIYDNNVDKNIIGYAYVSLSDYTGSSSATSTDYTGLPYLNEYYYDINNQPIISNYLNEKSIDKNQEDIVDLKNKVDNLIKDIVRTILVWGDSITWGSASTRNDNCYTAILRQKIIENGYIESVINCGVGGENFENILVRQGALGFYFADDVTLPASPLERVEVQRSENYINNRKYKNTYFGENSYFQLLLQGETGRDNNEPQYKTVNPIIVNGVECTLTLEGDYQNTVSYLSTNTQLDSPMLIKAGTFLYPNGSRFKGDINIFSIGTNGGFFVKNDGIIDIDASIAQYIELTDLAIEKSNSNNFIVCTPYAGGALRDLGIEGLKKLESAVTKRYGNRHFNWRKYLVEYGLLDAGIEATPEDLAAISKGEVPPSLLSDGLHPNDAGHKIIGERLYDMLVSLGYLTKVVA